MKKNTMHHPWYQRLLALGLAALLAFGAVPLNTRAEAATEEYNQVHISTVADDQTIGRPNSVYGQNTKNAGKVTVGKSVHNGAVTLNYGAGKTQTFTPDPNNFIITSSQAAQVIGLAAESAVPVDVVFVLDTSGSMGTNNTSTPTGRAEAMVEAANAAIAALMAANEKNRVGVVAFSGQGAGGGTSNNAAANVLSQLNHYADQSAANHLQWVNSSGNVPSNTWTNTGIGTNYNYIQGRGTDAGRRNGGYGGTNIHAGVALGAQMLTSASTTVVVDGEQVTRMPFLVVLSDGQPTYSASNDEWYNPSATSQQGPGNGAYSGNGFLPALTAAYYKGKITEHYYGEAASEKNRCYIYTIGIGLDSLSGDNKALAQITMDPDTYTTGDYAAAGAASYWNYGNTHDANTKDATHGWKTYWENYQKTPAADFGVSVDEGQWVNQWIGQGEEGTGRPQREDYYDRSGRFDRNAYEDAVEEWEEENYVRVYQDTLYTITAETIEATKRYVNGIGYTGGIAYNDDYFEADETSEIAAAFNKALQEIQLMSMSSPTHVDVNHGEDFSGYVTYTDPIGEYMEVKQVFGVVADGNYYQGKTFAQNMQNWNTSTSQEFKDQFLKVLKERCKVTGASLTDAKLLEIIGKAVASDNQAYYNSDSDYDNSFVWFGKSYTAPGEEDVQIQILDFADDDSIEYITDPDTVIPNGADYVCRSYYYYGTAGGTATNPNNEYLHFVVRVQRSLKAPYQETVVISAPASLLSMEKVLITEKTDAQGNKTYTAAITEADPARVVYEVGLRSDINAFNVEQILKQDAEAADDAYDYVGENAASTVANANYDAAKGEYYFYTNDWNRNESGHHRAMTHATFDAAADNTFYTYTQDTPIYTKSGDTYTLYNGTTKPSGEYYYAREVYDWSASTETGNTHTAVKRTEYILVDIPANAAAVKQGTNSWYIEKGVYKASSLSSAVEDVPKEPNSTGTATIVAHPHRTEDANNSHYTVLLGNNGKLTLKPADTKKVDITRPDRTDYNGTTVTGTTIQKADGKAVMVGDVLTYTVKVINGGTTAATATATDKIPAGTAYVDGSASEGGIYDSTTKTITWNIADIPAGHFVEVSFKVQVTEEALSGAEIIENAAKVTFDNEFSYTTNTTTNPPEGKKVTNSDDSPITGDVEVPDVLEYRIYWSNDSDSVADVIITDKIPTGTTFNIKDSEPTATKVENGVVTWVIEDAKPGSNGVVSFLVNVNAAAKETVDNSAIIKIGDHDPRVTNKVTVNVAKGDLVLEKVVVGYPSTAETKNFTLTITEIGLGLNGTFAYTEVRTGATSEGTVTFTNGIARLTILDGSIITIHGLPVGAVISVTETGVAGAVLEGTGFTPSYDPAATGSNAEGRVTIVEGDTPVKVTVTNTYAPAKAIFQLEASKQLVAGFTVENTGFSFTAYPCDKDGNVDTDAVPLSGEAVVSSANPNATFKFGVEHYDTVGDRYYLVSEINSGVAGINYTTVQYLVKVSVIDDGSGTLSASVTEVKMRSGDSGAFAAATSNDIVFTNAYTPKDAQIVLPGTKVLTGRAAADKEFSFTVKDGNGKTVANGYNTDTDDADALYNNIVFAPITVKAEDMGGQNSQTFTYYVTEDQGGAYGVTYSKDEYRATVTVANENAQLTVKSIVWEKKNDAGQWVSADSLVFNNTFTPDDVELKLEGTKTLLDADNNKLALTDQQFAFVVEQQKTDGTWERVTVGNSTLEQTSANSGIYKIGFSSIYYGLDDLKGATDTDSDGLIDRTFTYRIREVVPVGPGKNPNMHYDASVFTVTVTLYQKADGSLALTEPVYTGPNSSTVAFVNTKYPSTISVVPQAFKYTYTDRNAETGAEDVPADVSFSFEVLERTVADDGTIVLTKITEGIGSANPEQVDKPNVTFGAITFGNDDVGEHVYVIRESHRVATPVHGITHDLTEYAMKVVVSKSTAGQLSVTVTYHSYSNDTVGSVTTPVFKNQYEATGYLTVKAQKYLVLKDDPNNTQMDFAGKTFNFQLQRVKSPTDLSVVSGDEMIHEGVSNQNGEFNFGTLYFDENAVAVGETDVRYYKITEVNPRQTAGYGSGYPGVAYDSTQYVIGVQLTGAGGGHIDASVVAIYKDGVLLKDGENNLVGMENIVFTNTYKTEAGTSARIEATKVLEGRDPREGEFRFELYYVETLADGTTKEHLVDTAYNTDTNNDGLYDDIYFIRNYSATTPKGTYHYVIKEVPGNQSTIQYNKDNVIGKATVVIGENTEEATLTSAVSYPEGAVTFTNVFTPKGTSLTGLVGEKELINRPAVAGEFSFDVLFGGKSVATGFNTDLDNDGKYDEIQFTTINYAPADLWNATTQEYDTSKTFVYEVVEVEGTDSKITYSQQVYRLTVTVTLDADTGAMNASVTELKVKNGDSYADASVLAFRNTHTPDPITLKLEAIKVMKNHAMRDGSFSFLVHDISDPQNPKLVATGGNLAATQDAQGHSESDIIFSDIGYAYDMLGNAESRTFIYEIKEQATTHSGVTVHNDPYYAKVVLSLNDETGKLVTTTTYYTDEVCNTPITTEVPVFTNVYTPAPVEVEVYADKTLINKTLVADEFTFTLKGDGVNQSKTNAANGRVIFDKLTFNAPGEYRYILSESVTNSANAGNYTLDHDLMVIIKVTDNERGNLVATVDYHEVKADGSHDPNAHLGGAEFINHYTAPALTIPLNTEINATKTVKVPAGVTYSPAGFTFEVTDAAGNVIKGWENGVEVDMIGTSKDDGSITFPDFRFPSAGEYHYWITEKPSGVEGMTDDLRTWEVHILVRYNNQTGLLYVQDADVKTYLINRTASESTDPAFTNVFEPTAVTLTLEATKLLEGRDLKDREFLFYLMEGNTIVAQGHNDVNGKVKFALTYTAADIGSHAYTIKEMVPENANNGITYDKKTYVAVTINVSYDTVNRKLVASVGNTPVANGAVVSTGVTVTNQYAVEGTTAQINAHKVITANRVLKDKEFTFNLLDSQDKVVATAKNDAAGRITFQLSYDKAGTYTYKMVEQPGDDQSLRYDTKSYTVTVTVTDDLLGQLHAVVEYEDGVVPTFVNEYKALSATTVITAKKTLQGNKTLAAGDFTFELESEDGVKVTTKNGAGGAVLFGMRYDAAGVYTYTLREKAGDTAGVTYDDTEYTVVVTVTDNLEGSLVATVTYEGLADGETVPTFVNSYKGKAAAVQITAAKKLTGKTLTADAFSFTLTNKDNVKDVYTVKNDANGNVVFDLSLTEVGTYTYILAEATGTDANVAYDKNAYTVTVKVTDDLQGNLKAEVTYDTADSKAPTFENVHTPSAITVELTGKKTLKGRDLKADEFTFQVTDGSGNVVATAKNDAKGELKFSGIVLTEAGKYTYAVAEVKGSVKGMIYDDTKYIVTIEVTNDNGVLKATVTEPEGGLVFQNTYKTPDPTNPGTGDDTPLLLLVGMMIVSGGAVVALLAGRKKRHA